MTEGRDISDELVGALALYAFSYRQAIMQKDKDAGDIQDFLTVAILVICQDEFPEMKTMDTDAQGQLLGQLLGHPKFMAYMNKQNAK